MTKSQAMRPSEKLKEIEELVLDYAKPNSTTDGGNLYAEMLWLISRVKRLTNIILESRHRRSSNPMRERCSDTCYACWAHKSLEELS